MAFFYERGECHTFEGQLMTHVDHIVSRVVSRAKLPGKKRRCELDRELRAHLDDLAEEVRSQGYDDEAVARIVSLRFGEPREIATAFASVYAPERWAVRILQAAILFATSTIAVALVLSAVQSVAAVCTAGSLLATLRDLHQEVVGFGMITAGYCTLYAGERLFPRSLARAVLPSLTLGFSLAAVFAWLIPQHAALPVVAFACAACARLLQRFEIPFLWFAGTALPLLVGWALFGRLLSSWEFPWLVWLGLTISCKALHEIVGVFEKIFVQDFA